MPKKKPTAPAPEAILFSAGSVTYELIRSLGESRRGERMLLARSHSKGRAGALVVLKTVGAQAGPRVRKQLQEEARLATRLSHPRIARLHALHEHEGTLYAVTEHVEGDSVDAVFNDALLCGRYCSETFVLSVAADIASALHHAHTLTDARGAPLGILHRGIHPERILIGFRGEAKLMDFGLARAALSGRQASSRLGLGGRDVYASPEEILRQPMDGRSDLFALGLVMLELLTGQHLLWPMEDVDLRRLGKDLAAVPQGTLTTLDKFVQEIGQRPEPARKEQAQLTHRARALSFEDVERVAREVPEPTRSILHKLLRRDPSERYATAAELEQALRDRLRALGHRGAPEVAEEVFELKAEAAGFAQDNLLFALLEGAPESGTDLDPEPLPLQP